MCLHDMGSARFSQDETYFGEMVMHAGIREEVIRWMQLLRAWLQDFPFEKADHCGVVRVKCDVHIMEAHLD